MPRHKSYIYVPIYVPHIQNSALNFRPLQRTLPFEVQKVFVHTPALGRSRAFMRWMAGPPGAVGRKLPVRPIVTPVLLTQILRTLKGYDSYNSLLLPPRLPGEKLPPEVFEYFREIKRSKEEQMKVKYMESLAQENGENSTVLELLASLSYLYWEINQLLSTCQVPGRLQVSWGFPFWPLQNGPVVPIVWMQTRGHILLSLESGGESRLKNSWGDWDGEYM